MRWEVPIEGIDTFAGSIEYIESINWSVDLLNVNVNVLLVADMSDAESISHEVPTSNPSRPGSRQPIAFNIQTFPNVNVDWSARKFFIRDGDTNVEYIASVNELIKLVHTSGAIAKKWSMPDGVPSKYIGIIGALWTHLPPNSNAYFSYKDDDDNVSRSKTLVRYEHVFKPEQIKQLLGEGAITEDLIADMTSTFPKPTSTQKEQGGTDLDGVGSMMRMYSNTRVGQTAFIHGLVIATDKAQFHMAKQQAGKEERARKRAAKAKPYERRKGGRDNDEASTTISLRNKMDMWGVRDKSSQGRGNDEDVQEESSNSMQI
ncbi:hypothetical protein DFH05DRAFT_1480301 [Lentinula detonsa]|uniref:Uncharacterized protein n=1 Tax=Lentinula detonsa TaxID=2804962 RepID=A0A9W8P5R1_9AGAR|nr:hypothetical protein DFH05DRAFT_1480301 [Lentinula detonsa]